MKIFKILFSVVVITMFFASCSRHTTCSAYGASIDKVSNDLEELHAQSQIEGIEVM